MSLITGCILFVYVNIPIHVYSIYYHTDRTGDASVTMDEEQYKKPVNVNKKEETPQYQPISVSSGQGSHSYANVQMPGVSVGHGGPRGHALQPKIVTGNEDIYETCT